MRVLVLWRPCRRVDLGGHIEWARAEADALMRCDAVAALALHPSAAGGLPPRRMRSLCLELRLGEGLPAESLFRERCFGELIAHLRLFDMPPTVLQLESDV